MFQPETTNASTTRRLLYISCKCQGRAPHVQPPPPKATRYSAEAILADLRKEELVLIGQPLVVPPDLLNNTVLACAEWACRIVVQKTPMEVSLDKAGIVTAQPLQKNWENDIRTVDDSCGCT